MNKIGLWDYFLLFGFFIFCLGLIFALATILFSIFCYITIYLYLSQGIMTLGFILFLMGGAGNGLLFESDINRWIKKRGFNAN
jgi:hypothetical protein